MFYWIWRVCKWDSYSYVYRSKYLYSIVSLLSWNCWKSIIASRLWFPRYYVDIKISKVQGDKENTGKAKNHYKICQNELKYLFKKWWNGLCFFKNRKTSSIIINVSWIKIKIISITLDHFARCQLQRKRQFMSSHSL